MGAKFEAWMKKLTEGTDAVMFKDPNNPTPEEQARFKEVNAKAVDPEHMAELERMGYEAFTELGQEFQTYFANGALMIQRKEPEEDYAHRALGCIVGSLSSALWMARLTNILFGRNRIVNSVGPNGYSETDLELVLQGYALGSSYFQSDFLEKLQVWENFFAGKIKVEALTEKNIN